MLEQKIILLKKSTLLIFTKIKTVLYILIPMLCILFWGFIALYKDNFTLIPAADFPTFYYVAQLIFTQPEQIYFLKAQPYTYTPFFATIFAPMGLLTFEQAHWFYFFVIFVISEIILIIFNQILTLKKVSNKFNRFLFLFTLSNGLIYVEMFDTLTGRIFTALGLIWFLKREIEFRELNKDTTKKHFIFSQMMILMFAFGITLQYVFLVILYLFHNVNIKEIFSKIQLKRYFFLIFTFLIQNFMLIIILLISPEAIGNLIGGAYRGERPIYIPKTQLTYSFLLSARPRDPVDGITITIYVLSCYYDLSNIQISVFLISILIMTIITIIINLKKNFNIENKFGFWALLSLFFYTFTQTRYFIGLLPMITILFLDYPLKTDKNLVSFIRYNYLQLIGLFCIIILYFLPPIHYLIRVFPFLVNIPIAFLFLKYIYVYITLVLILYLLKRKK